MPHWLIMYIELIGDAYENKGILGVYFCKGELRTFCKTGYGADYARAWNF